MTSAQVLCLPQKHEFIEKALPPAAVVNAPLAAVHAKGWEPSPVYTASWLAAHRDHFNLVHLHFGFDAIPHSRLLAWTRTLKRHRLPLVFTVHDLRNPHHGEAENYDGQLEILLAAAQEVVTLTPGAATEIGARFGLRASVVPHPPLLPPMAQNQRSGVVGISLKPRAQVVDPDRLVAAALSGVDAARSTRPEVSLQVTAHPAMLPSMPLTVAAEAAGRLELQVLTRLTEGEFATSLNHLEVAVLPYRFGTHSGWLEACRDVGTRVVAPDCGYYSEQWDEVVSYTNNERLGFDGNSLTDATHRALLAGPLRPASAQEERIRASRASYAAIYDRALLSAA